MTQVGWFCPKPPRRGWGIASSVPRWFVKRHYWHLEGRLGGERITSVALPDEAKCAILKRDAIVGALEGVTVSHLCDRVRDLGPMDNPLTTSGQTGPLRFSLARAPYGGIDGDFVLGVPEQQATSFSTGVSAM